MKEIISNREYRVTMAKNLIGCWGSPAANQILRHSNPLFISHSPNYIFFCQLHNKKQIKEQ